MYACLNPNAIRLQLIFFFTYGQPSIWSSTAIKIKPPWRHRMKVGMVEQIIILTNLVEWCVLNGDLLKVTLLQISNWILNSHINARLFMFGVTKIQFETTTTIFFFFTNVILERIQIENKWLPKHSLSEF